MYGKAYTQAQETLKIIRNSQALVKTVRSSCIDFHCWDHLLDQLADPVSARPVKPINEDEIDRGRIFDPLIKTWSSRNLDRKVRGAKKQTTYTKKMSASFLPPHGNMQLFEHGIGEDVALIFDSTKCELKDKYIFLEGINSNTKPWLKRKELSETQQPAHAIKPIPLEQLKISYPKLKEIKPFNEILARFSQESLIGILAVQNSLLHRIVALAMHDYIYKKLNLDLPIFFIRDNPFGTDIERYTQSGQADDIRAAQYFNEREPVNQYFKMLLPETIRHYQIDDIDNFQPESIINPQQGLKVLYQRRAIDAYYNYFSALAKQSKKVATWSIYTDLRRVYGSDSYYEKKELSSKQLSGLSLLAIFQSDFVSHLGLEHAVIISALNELRELQLLCDAYPIPKYYWEKDSICSTAVINEIERLPLL